MRHNLCINIIEGTAAFLLAMTEYESFRAATEEEDFQAAASKIQQRKFVYTSEQDGENEESGATLQQHIDQETFNALALLWGNKAFRLAAKTLQRIGKYDVPDTYEMIMDKLIGGYPSWGGEEWKPSDDDIMLARARTSGFRDQEFMFSSVKFRIIDVGGQRAERRKWIHMFQDVTAVLYVAALSEYDQTLYEESSVNRMKTSIDVFEEYVNRVEFDQSAVILFLNKHDLFLTKFLEREIPLNVSGEFPDAPTEVREYLFFYEVLDFLT